MLPTTPAPNGGLSAASLTYGQPLSALTISGVMTNALGVVVPGTFAFSTPALIPAAGACTASVIFTPTDAIDYTAATNNIKVTVSPAPLTITAVNAGKTYGQTHTFPGTGFAAVGLVNGDKVTTVALSSAGAPNTAPVGAYAIVPGSIVKGSINPANYAITWVSGTLHGQSGAADRLRHEPEQGLWPDHDLRQREHDVYHQRFEERGIRRHRDPGGRQQWRGGDGLGGRFAVRDHPLRGCGRNLQFGQLRHHVRSGRFDRQLDGAAGDGDAGVHQSAGATE